MKPPHPITTRFISNGIAILLFWSTGTDIALDVDCPIATFYTRLLFFLMFAYTTS